MRRSGNSIEAPLEFVGISTKFPLRFTATCLISIYVLHSYWEFRIAGDCGS